MGKRGLTIIELLISGVLLTGMLYAGMTGYQLISRENISLFTRADVETEVLALTQHILKVGRHAGNFAAGAACFAMGAPPNSVLTCNVDFEIPGPGPLVSVRFRGDGQSVFYERLNGGIWITQIVYSGITNFELCNDLTMQNGTCALAPAITALYNAPFVAAVPVTRANRLFRFRITGNILGPTNGLGNHVRRGFYSRPVVIQSAFFVRNPGPFGSRYQWGQ